MKAPDEYGINKDFTEKSTDWIATAVKRCTDVFRIGYPAIAGPPKSSPAIAGVLVVDFGWYHYSGYRYSMILYPLMCLKFRASPI